MIFMDLYSYTINTNSDFISRFHKTRVNRGAQCTEPQLLSRHSITPAGSHCGRLDGTRAAASSSITCRLPTSSSFFSRSGHCVAAASSSPASSTLAVIARAMAGMISADNAFDSPNTQRSSEKFADACWVHKPNQPMAMHVSIVRPVSISPSK